MSAIPALLFAFLLSIASGDATPSGESRAASDGMQSKVSEPDQIPEINGMAYIPAGVFLMGSTSDDLHNQAEIDEYPQRPIWVDGFYMDIHEVTNAQYKVFLDSVRIKPPSRWKNGNYPIGMDGYPVVNITWEDAAMYARFVGKRLPTEEEWEKAARGEDGRRFPWGNDFDDDKGNNSDQLMQIMRFPDGVSPYGLYDMAGNVAEWVDAWYAPYPRGEGDVLDRDFPEHKPLYGDQKYRVYRGGSWNNFGRFLRCSNREKAKPNARWGNVGFRCAMDPPWKKKF
jgi:formylglycine-generating enzyme required for sulfatase activity